jgi:hypothetical protein
MAEEQPTRHAQGVEAPPSHPEEDEAAHASLAETLEQQGRTSLEDETEAHTTGELADGLERALDQPAYGREGS